MQASAAELTMEAATHTRLHHCGLCYRLREFVVGSLAWVMVDYRTQPRNIADLEKQGVNRGCSRRSTGEATGEGRRVTEAERKRRRKAPISADAASSCWRRSSSSSGWSFFSCSASIPGIHHGFLRADRPARAENDLAAGRRPRSQRRTGARNRPGPLQGRGNAHERLGVMVRAVPRRSAAARGARARHKASCHRHQLQGRPENARRFLGRYGDPFAAVGADKNGRAAIEWGVYGVPETFVIGRDGRIAYKLVGPITPENLDTVIKPEIEKAFAAGS